MEEEIDEVLCLVAQPIKNRFKLLNGQSKFVLNSLLLFKINKVLDVITTDSVDIILPEEKRKRLQLLLNVLNNVPKLTITQRSTASFENVINLNKFKRLRHLELTRVCLTLIVGLDSLKTQLESFICNRCCEYNGILCKQKELEWPELTCFDLRYMKLDHTSSGFFMNKPWIQVLNLSFNRLTVINGLDYLDHLVVVNISFNHLENIPTFSKYAETKLEILIINNNYLSSLAGIEKLPALKNLSVNYNFISDKTEYFYLSNLKKLHTLDFAHNPVSSIPYTNTYLAASLSKEVPQDKFLLNNRSLTNAQCYLLGKKYGLCKHWQTCSISQPLTNAEIPPEPRSKYRTGKRISKPRNVVIEEGPSEDTVTEKQLENLPESAEAVLPSSIFPQPENLETSYKENELMEQLKNEMDENVDETSTSLKSSRDLPENVDTVITLRKEIHTDNANQDSDVEATTMLISATVHASDSDIVETQTLSSPQDINSEPENLEIKNNDDAAKSKNVSDRSSESNEDPTENIDVDISQNNVSTDDIVSSKLVAEDTLVSNQERIPLSDESDEVYSDIEDEVFWQVESVDKASGQSRNIILILLDNELKERSTETGRTMTRWPLSKIQSCTKTKIDPVTVELEFDTLKKSKQFRTYIMEFPDAQVLLKKVYAVLESKPLSSMNQKTYECIRCGSFFVRSMPSIFKSRDSQVYCSVCSSTLVIEVEEPKLPEPQPLTIQAISSSSSHSSIGKGNIMAEEAACTEWKSPCSATSLDQNSSLDRRFSAQKYESDIEVISNPSQSSIEVLGEHSRSVTPRRKISNEDRSGGLQAPNYLSTVMEVTSPFSNLTESSSSGSLTESVITAYEALNNNRKTVIPEGTLAEEESSPTFEPDPLSDALEEEKPTSVWQKSTNIYSFTDFTDVDPRIKLFLYQSLFQDDNEALLLFVKCHLWKTGGSDFDGCAVFSTSKVYFLSHSKTNFNEDYCDWLTLFDTYPTKDIKDISPIVGQQGARVQFKHISYLILVLDKERTANLLKHMRGFLTSVKIQNNVNNSFELSLQQAVLSSSKIEKTTDPSVNTFTVCLSVTILKDEVEQEILRLGGLIMTSGEFHLLPGDLTWLSATAVPTIIISQSISNLIAVEQGKYFVDLHFLDEKDAIEEVWCLKLVSDFQVSNIVDSIRTPWEKMFSASLEVIVRY